MSSTATIVEPCGEKKSRGRSTSYKFKVISESAINEFRVNYFSEDNLIVQTQVTSRPDVDEFNYKMLCLGCFRKDSNFFKELREAGVEFDDKSSRFKVSFTIGSKQYEFYRVTDDGAQVNIRHLDYRPE